MCDCTEEEIEEESREKREALETVTLFEKCPRSTCPPQNIEFSTCGIEDDKNDSQSAIQCVQPDSSEVMTCSTIEKPCTCNSDSSSESTRVYKFVTPRRCKFKDEVEGEAERKYQPLTFEPCETLEEFAEEPDIECTLAIIKPEAVVYRKEIEKRIEEEGFEILQTRWLQLSPEQVSDFYSDCYGQLNFAHLVAYMSSEPIIVHVLAKNRAVQDWRFIIGPSKVAEARLYFPDSIRARFGRRGEDFKNAVHGSIDREQAEKEIHFFFPEFVVEPLLKSDMAADYLWETINPILIEGLSLCCKRKPADPILWLAHWLLANNPNKPKMPDDLTFVSV